MSKRINFKTLSAHKTPDDSPGYLLWRVSTKWRGAIEDALKPLDLTHPQFVVLATIGWLTRAGAKVSQADIGRTSGLDPNTVSQVIRGLEAKKLIDREQTQDERSKNPVLTDHGAKKLALALPTVEHEDAKFFAMLERKEMSLLIKMFQKLLGSAPTRKLMP